MYNNLKNTKTTISQERMIELSKKTEKKQEHYPIEFPSRTSKTERSPITDTVESEVFPLNANIRHQSGVHLTSQDTIAEVVATEVYPENEVQTIHGRNV